MKAKIVIGLGFGDEGKGRTTDYLCQNSDNPLVIRFNGGQQAGHTVVSEEGKRHVFSNFGAGTLRGVPTYWSAYCTVSPLALYKELMALMSLKLAHKPRLRIDNLCPVTTHYDIMYNRAVEAARGNERHGSCGMGFGCTIERHTLSPVRLYAQDLLFQDVLKLKLKAIQAYYREKVMREQLFDFDSMEHEKADTYFLDTIKEFYPLSKTGIISFVTEESQLDKASNKDTTYIFEGAQGILLDMDFGFFPHVTRSHTTSRNALELLKKYDYPSEGIEIYYITRAYQTRHGEGPMTNHSLPLKLMHNETETNCFNEFQGNFRTNVLDIDLLNYALISDSNFSNSVTKNCVITCLDQVDSQAVLLTQNGQISHTPYSELPQLLKASFKNTLFSFADSGSFKVLGVKF